MNNFEKFLIEIGITPNHHILIHSGFSAIKKNFHLNGEEVISAFKNLINPDLGSLIFPTFTYCFKRRDNSNEIFNRQLSPSKVGYLSELFRNSSDVIRTSSPTHSFSLWGRVTDIFDESNSPESPLGENSVCEWLNKTENSYVVMLNVNFTAFTMGHYYEVYYKVPWFDFSPWAYLGVENIGVSTSGEIHLKEIPGCAKSFINFEKYLLEKKRINKYFVNNFWAYFINLSEIQSDIKFYFTQNFINLLCDSETCNACKSRREFLKERGLI